jgi:hypothetical protein
MKLDIMKAFDSVMGISLGAALYFLILSSPKQGEGAMDQTYARPQTMRSPIAVLVHPSHRHAATHP